MWLPWTQWPKRSFFLWTSSTRHSSTQSAALPVTAMLATFKQVVTLAGEHGAGALGVGCQPEGPEEGGSSASEPYSLAPSLQY